MRDCPLGAMMAPLEYRNAAGSTTAVQQWGPPYSYPQWMKLVRAGSLFTAYTSYDGFAWATFGSVTVPMGSQILAGLAVSAENNGALAMGTFQNVSVSNTPHPPPVSTTITSNLPINGLDMWVGSDDGPRFPPLPSNCATTCTAAPPWTANGGMRSLYAPATFTDQSGATYTLTEWTDGATIYPLTTQNTYPYYAYASVPAPYVNTTYTAVYSCGGPYRLTILTSGSGTVAVTPQSSDGNYSCGTAVTITAYPSNSNTAFASFTGNLGGAATQNNSVTVIMNPARAVQASFVPLQTPSTSFYISVSPTTPQPVGLPGSAAYFILGPPNTAITYTTSQLPPGVTVAFGGVNSQGIASMTVTAASNAVPQTSTITITGTRSASPTTATASFQLRVNGPAQATMVSPVQGAVLPASSAPTFTWAGGSGVTQYNLSLCCNLQGQSFGTHSYAASTLSDSLAIPAPYETPNQALTATLGSLLIDGAWRYSTTTYRLQTTGHGIPTSLRPVTSPPVSPSMNLSKLTSPGGTRAAATCSNYPPYVFNNWYGDNEAAATTWTYVLTRDGQPGPDAGQIDQYSVKVLRPGSTTVADDTVTAKLDAIQGTCFSSVSAFDLKFYANPLATPGARAVKVTYKCIPGQDSYEDCPQGTIDVLGDNAITVYATPHITSSQQDPDPAIPGSPFYLNIIGTNFGPASGGSLTFCRPGTPDPCDTSQDFTYSTFTIGGLTYWRDTEIRYFVTPVTTPTPATGRYEVQVKTKGENGLSFLGFQQPGQQTTKPTSDNRATVTIGQPPAVTLTQLGWGNNQEIWKATTYASNGDSPLFENAIVWHKDPATGIVILNEPWVAYKTGTNLTHLRDISLKTDTLYNGSATLRVDVFPNDFSFATQSIQFTQGNATLGNLNLQGTMPNVIANTLYTLTWQLRFDSGGLPPVFHPFETTRHQMFLIHDWVDNGPPAQYRVTTKRLDYVTSYAQGPDNIDSILSKLGLQLGAKPGRDATVTLATPDNAWAALDREPDPVTHKNPPGLDCESVSTIAVVQLWQLGYAAAAVRLAYPTGAIPLGNTDARDKEQQVLPDGVYSLSFPEQNYFEGYLYLPDPNIIPSPGTTPPAIAFTVYPLSDRLNPTGCMVAPNTIDNTIPFRVLTSTYRAVSQDIPGHPITAQRWLWDITDKRNEGRLRPFEPFLPEVIPFAAQSCPSLEYP